MKKSIIVVFLFIFVLVAGSATVFAQQRLGVGLVATQLGVKDLNLDAVTRCLVQAGEKNQRFFIRSLGKLEKKDRVSLMTAGKKAGVDHVFVTDFRSSKDGVLAMIQDVEVKTGRTRFLSLPLGGGYGRACDAGFIGIVQLLTPEPSKEARTFIDLGEKALAASDVELAFARYMQAMDADISSPLPPRLIARVYLKAGNPTEALNWYSTALSRQATDAWTFMEAADAALRAGNKELALQDYEYAVMSGARIPMLLKLTGRFYLETRQSSLAAENLKEALDLDADDVEILPLLVNALEEEERWSEAAEYQETYNRRHLTYEGLDALARFHERSQAYTAAFPVLRQLVKSSPGDADLRRRLGESLEKAGRVEEAMAVFQDLRRMKPDDERTLKAIGRIYYGQKKFAEAIEVFQSARALDPFDSDLLRLDGMAREFSGDIDGALILYAEALRWDADVKSSDVARFLALAKKTGRLESSVSTVRALLPKKDQDGRRVLVMAIGERLTLDGDTDEAVRFYESVTDSLGMFAPPLLALGDLYVKKGEYERALNSYLRAVVWFSDSRIPLYGALKLHDAGALPQARKLYDYAFSRDSDNVAVSLALAEILLLLDDDPEMINVYLVQADRIPKNDQQKMKHRYLMIQWGLRTGRLDFSRTYIRFMLDELPKRPAMKLSLTNWKNWPEERLQGDDLTLSRDVIALFERTMTPDEFKKSHIL